MIKTLTILMIAISIVSCNHEITIAELGNQVPEYTFTNILNDQRDEISLSDLKGKIVILEFWATWCGPCIPAMRKLDSLQTSFKDDIEVITISGEDNPRLEKFVKSTNSNLTIASDTLHTSVFKYQTIPHSIVVDKTGIVRAITSPENITKEVLQDLISNDEISVDVKDDFYIDRTLEVETIKAVSNSFYRIELKNYDQEKRGGSKALKDLDGNINGIEIWNSPIPRLYQTLFNVASPSRMVFKDSLSYDDFPYQKEHQYNMIIEVSEGYNDQWKQIGIDFLNEQFQVNARMATDSLDCYVLKNIDNRMKASSAEDSEYMFMGPILKTKKIKMSKLVKYLENFKSLPVLDKTNLLGEYDIELEWQEEDPKTLYTELEKYGLKLEKSDQKLPVEVMEIYKKRLKN